MGVADYLSETILGAYNAVIQSLPPWAQTFINLFLIVLLVVIYAVFIWKLYRFVAAKNFLGLNLAKYSNSQNPFFTKLLVGALYFFEYLILSA